MRRGCTDPSPLTWPTTEKSDGTDKFAMTSSVDGCRILLDQFVGNHLRKDSTWALSVGDFLPPMVASGERPKFDIKPR